MHVLLLYDYVENMLERRAPYREAHLALWHAAIGRGELLLAGTLGDPVNGAAFLFRGEARGAVEALVAADPYVQNGLVTRWQVLDWATAFGPLAQKSG